MAIYRVLYRSEAEMYLAHLRRLDFDARYARFAGSMNDEAIYKYWSAIDWRSLTILGFFSDGKLRGVAEIRYEPRLFPKSAELAFSVERGFQNSRVGTTLMRRALLFLANRGIGVAHIVCLLNNRRMQRLALKHRCFVQASSGDVFMTVTVPPLDTASVLAEFWDSQLLWMASLWGVPTRFALKQSG
jgi:RimJ/RimL family protein N-acetyltransferase